MTTHQTGLLRRDKLCSSCHKKLKKDDSYNCWKTGCQTDGARCGNCAEIHEDWHIRMGET